MIEISGRIKSSNKICTMKNDVTKMKVRYNIMVDLYNASDIFCQDFLEGRILRNILYTTNSVSRNVYLLFDEWCKSVCSRNTKYSNYYRVNLNSKIVCRSTEYNCIYISCINYRPNYRICICVYLLVLCFTAIERLCILLIVFIH